MIITADLIRNRVLRAFWHRTRKQFVPLTPDEVCRRAKCSPVEARPILYNLAQTKIARASNTGAGQYSVTTWELLPKGEGMVTAQLSLTRPAEQIIRAEAIARSA